MGRALVEPAGGTAVVALARHWIGTPYRHQASCKGAGADCLGLVRGVWRELLGEEPAEVPPYTPDWAESSDSQDLLHAAARHLVPLPTEDAAEGDVVVMKMRDRGPAKHVGILALGAARHETLIHAYSGHGVVESPLTPAWKRRIVGVFRFPDRSN